MSWIMVDVEANGPVPGRYSMIELGAVVVRDGLADTFHAKMAPLDSHFKSDALKAIGVTHEETLAYPSVAQGMYEFCEWLRQKSVGRPLFVSDNNGFDWQFVNYYMWMFMGKNPFGYSSTNLGSLYKGLARDCFQNFKHLRKTKHTHHPVDDAMGNAEAMLHMVRKLGLKTRID